MIEDITDIGTATAFAPAVDAKSPTVTTPKRDDYKIPTNTNANNRANRNANAVLESFLIEADKTKISQVLSNLLSNALSSIRLKAGEGEGRIIISVSRTQKMDGDDEIIVNITDNGQGIPPDVAQNLFTKFVSGSNSGTGLGLYISKNIIEAHGGRIWARNNDAAAAAANETTDISSTGATFSFALPVLEIVAKSKSS
jgi:signal transduction histidine kinase